MASKIKSWIWYILSFFINVSNPGVYSEFMMKTDIIKYYSQPNSTYLILVISS